MKFIKTNEANQIVFINYEPTDELKGGFYVEEIPEPTYKEGYVGILNYTPDKGFWTEYQETPKSKEEREELLEQDVSTLKNKLSEMQKAMAEMSMTIAMKGGVN
jgi:hypothetical protein